MLRKQLGSVYCVMGLMTLLSSCATVQVESDYDRNARFQNYHTFTVMQREHSGTRNPLVAVRAEDAIRADLRQKGYVEAGNPAAADVAVDFTIGSRERTDINSYPEPYVAGGWGDWGLGDADWLGGPYWGESLDVHQYREGTLSVDVFDTHTHRPVWHGWAKKELTREDLERSEGPIQRAVAAVLTRFPPRSSQ
jgi:hypothetical protein